MDIQVGDKIQYYREVATVARIDAQTGYAIVMVGPFARFVSVRLEDIRPSLEALQAPLPMFDDITIPPYDFIPV